MFFGGAPRVLNMPYASLRFSTELVFLPVHLVTLSDEFEDRGMKGND